MIEIAPKITYVKDWKIAEPLLSISFAIKYASNCANSKFKPLGVFTSKHLGDNSVQYIYINNNV